MKKYNLIIGMLVFLFAISCEKKDNGGDCDDGSSDYELNLSLDHLQNNVTIEARDLDSDSDYCTDYDFLIIVAPLNGVSSSEEIALALKNNSIYNKRIAITEEGVKQHSVNLSNLDEYDDAGQLMIYAVLSLKVPLGMTPAEYQSSTDLNGYTYLKFRYFGVYEGGDAPDVGPCDNCENGTCPNGTPISCGCHGGFCLCTLCMEEIIFE
jgi:hypothetical protein